jgi:hypothetical protein
MHGSFTDERNTVVRTIMERTKGHGILPTSLKLYILNNYLLPSSFTGRLLILISREEQILKSFHS